MSQNRVNFRSEIYRNMQKCPEICKNLQISRRNRPRTAEMAGGPSPAGTACPSRNIEKPLVFLAFSRVRPPAAAAGRGHVPHGRQGLAGLSGDLTQPCLQRPALHANTTKSLIERISDESEFSGSKSTWLFP